MPPSPLTVRLSDGDGAANDVKTDAIIKLKIKQFDFSGRLVLTVT